MTDNTINTNYYNQIAVPKSTVNSTKSTATDFSSLLQSAVKASDQKQTGESSGTMADIFDRAAAAFNVPVNLLKAVAKNESNFDTDAVSTSGAQGVMQLMPSTAKSLGVTDSLDAEQNIMGGAKYLSQMLSRYDGDTTLALAAYNAGSGNVAKYGGVPPFKQTQTYISRVMQDAGEAITAPTTQLPSLASVLGSSLSSNFGTAQSSDFGSALTSLLGASSSGSLDGLSSLGGLDSSSGTSNLNGLDSLLSNISSLRGTTGAASTSAAAASNATGKAAYTYDDYISFLQLYIAQMQASALQTGSSESDPSQAMSSDVSGLTSSEDMNSLL